MARQCLLALVAVALLFISGSWGQKVIVPSYIYPETAAWTAINSANPHWTQIALINPNNGPGTFDTNYLKQTQQSQAKGIKIYGYVHTSYGQRGIAAVLSDIATFYTWYNVNGIFIDEAATACSVVSYYQTIYHNVSSRGGGVIINPGVLPSECYMNASDIVLSSEYDWTTYQTVSPASWVANYPATRFYHCIYNVSAAQMPKAVYLASQRNAGYVYITDQTLPNPYGALSSYWNSFIGLVAASAVLPAPATMPSTAGPVWHNFNITSDGTNLYLKFNSYNSFNLNGGPKYTYPRINFFFDLDNNTSTGYAAGAVGSELLVQGTSAYRQAVNTFNSGYIGAVTVSTTVAISAATITVPISMIRSAYTNAATIRVVGLNDEISSWIPQSGSAVQFTLGTVTATQSMDEVPTPTGGDGQSTGTTTTTTTTSSTAKTTIIVVVVVVVVVVVAAAVALGAFFWIRSRRTPEHKPTELAGGSTPSMADMISNSPATSSSNLAT